MNVASHLKMLLYRLCGNCFPGFRAEREKVWLRQKVMDSPIGLDYPFDPEAKLLRAIGVAPAMLDIGANTGLYSATLEDLVGARNLYLFEPLPDLNRQLREKFKRARVLAWALSDHEGEQNIRVPYIAGERFDTRATLNFHSEPGQSGHEEIPVRVCTLDAAVRNLAIPAIGFVKIDVEGHELEVINGGTETLTRFRPLVLIEIEARHHHYPMTMIFARFKELGYHGYYVDPDTCALLDIADFDSDRDQQQEHLRSGNVNRYLNNFFFVHTGSEASFVAAAKSFLESEKRRG